MKIITQDNNQRFLKLCKKYQQHIVILFDKGILDIKRGNATLHFDEQGRIRRIEKITIDEKGLDKVL